MSARNKFWLLILSVILLGGILTVSWLFSSTPALAQEPRDHSTIRGLQGPFESPEEVTEACLNCHDEAATEVMATIHWTWNHTDPVTGQEVGKNNVINNYCVAVASNEPRCTSCHVGYGYKDNTFFDTATERNVDCLVCHDSTGSYKKFPTAAGYPVLGEAKEFGGKTWEPVDLAAVAQQVASPDRANCGTCHFFGGGGDAVKHGDLDSSMGNPTPDLDVHMSPETLDFSCSTCHVAAAHQIPGRIYNGEERVLCEDCHSDDQAPHQDSDMVEVLSQHTEAVACQTCHIPAYARGQATKLTWDWSTAGDRDENGKFIVRTDDAGHVVYDGRKGSFTHGENVTPYYSWWNGNTYYLTAEDEIDSTQMVTINTFEGSPGDGKIYPFKRFTGIQPYDADNNTMVVPHLFPSGPDDTSAYWKGYDWDQAITAGMDYAGVDYSGNLDWIDTEMFWVQNHMVAPKENALQCQDCHAENGRLDWQALGYSPDRAAVLVNAANEMMGAAPAPAEPAAPAETPSEAPAQLPVSGTDLSLMPWLFAGLGALLALGGGLVWKRRR